MSDIDRRARAEARRTRVVLRKSVLHGDDVDLVPVRGPEAVSLVHRLTRESWRLAGLAEPSYARGEAPVRFVPRQSR